MNKNESYVPSEEEIKNAEERMGPKKAKLSAEREGSAQRLKGMGMEGYLEKSLEGDDAIISGTINGHTVVIRGARNEKVRYKWKASEQEENARYKWTGEVDGSPLEPIEISKFFDKYHAVWAKVYLGDLNDAQKEELGDPKKRQILKEIGL